MAILGEAYFDALQGSVTSSEALSNPYDPLVSIGRNDFLRVPFLKRVITDTHFDNPDRRGRHFTFLARCTRIPDLPGEEFVQKKKLPSA